MMMDANKRFRRGFLYGFKYAFNGIVHVVRTERNMKIHMAMAILVIALGFVFRVTVFEWCLLLLCISSVIAAEMLNSVAESLCDLINTEYDRRIAIIKDVAAGAVLVNAVIAAVIGCIIFLPHIFGFLVSLWT